jgi:hypothetical protein
LIAKYAPLSDSALAQKNVIKNNGMVVVDARPKPLPPLAPKAAAGQKTQSIEKPAPAKTLDILFDDFEEFSDHEEKKTEPDVIGKAQEEPAQPLSDVIADEIRGEGQEEEESVHEAEASDSGFDMVIQSAVVNG